MEYEQEGSEFPLKRQNNTLPIYGNKETMNLNTMILTNIRASPYFKTDLFELKTFHEVVDEIYYKVEHLEPWEKNSRKLAGQVGMCAGVRGVGAGGIVSTAYCILYKLFTLRLTRRQLKTMLNHTDSPYIRGLGFMYIRYCQPPPDFWDWYEPYINDEEEIDLKAGGGYLVTIGEVARSMMTKLDWFGTLFPRIPVNVQKELEDRIRLVKQITRQTEAVAVGLPMEIQQQQQQQQQDYDWNGNDNAPDDEEEPPGDGWRRSSRDMQSEKPAKEKSGERSREPSRGRSRDREKRTRDRSRSKERDRSRDDRSRDEKPAKEKSGERSREPSRGRSRDREKRTRDRSRSKERDRSRDDRRRENERSRERPRDRSRSRERPRDRSRERFREKRRSISPSLKKSRERNSPTRTSRKDHSSSKDSRRKSRSRSRSRGRNKKSPDRKRDGSKERHRRSTSGENL